MGQIDNQYTSAAASGAEVLLLQTSGTYCTQGMADVEKGSWHPVVIMSGTCASKGQFFQPLIDQGLTGKDTYTILNLKDPLDPANGSDPFIKTYTDVMTKAGFDPSKSTSRPTTRPRVGRHHPSQSYREHKPGLGGGHS
jgi:branched-chain amino acid transport system substrate-binding protein